MAMHKHLTYWLQCTICGKEYLGHNKKRMYCSQHCRQLAAYRIYTIKPLDGRDSGKQWNGQMATVTFSLKGGTAVEIDEAEINDLDADAFRKCLLFGIQHYLGAGMTGEGFKSKGLEGKELEDLQEAVKEKAAANWENIKANRFGERGVGKTAKIPGVVKTRAMQICRVLIKDAIRREGLKASEFKAKEITEFAKAYLEEHPEVIEQAKQELAALENKAKETITLPESFTAGKAKAKPRVAPKRPPAKRKEEVRARA